MGEEIDRGGGIGVSDLEHLEPIVGRAPGIARIRLAQRLGHLLRRDLDLLAALLCAGDTLLGKLADHARQCDLGESEQRHRETIRSVHSSFHFTLTHGTLPFLNRNHFPRRYLRHESSWRRRVVPLPCFDQFFDELQSSPNVSMPDESRYCPFDLRLSLKISSRMSIQTNVYLQE